LATAIQARLHRLVTSTLRATAVDVRPEPERVCRRAGCLGVSVGVLLARNGRGCALVALVSAPGQSPARLIPWVGQMTLSAGEVRFREPPESEVTITDFALCDEVVRLMSERESAVAEAIEAAAASTTETSQ
jgi:hypothetical protein